MKLRFKFIEVEVPEDEEMKFLEDFLNEEDRLKEGLTTETRFERTNWNRMKWVGTWENGERIVESLGFAPPTDFQYYLPFRSGIDTKVLDKMAGQIIYSSSIPDNQMIIVSAPKIKKRKGYKK